MQHDLAPKYLMRCWAWCQDRAVPRHFFVVGWEPKKNGYPEIKGFLIIFPMKSSSWLMSADDPTGCIALGSIQVQGWVVFLGSVESTNHKSVEGTPNASVHHIYITPSEWPWFIKLSGNVVSQT
jgi:hypothetical protein